MKHYTSTIGWDLGGAHLKAAYLDEDRKLTCVVQLPCPLWQGLSYLENAIDEVLRKLPSTAEGIESRGGIWHAVTMTGELVDLFASRHEGVGRLVETFGSKVGVERTRIYAGNAGFISPDNATAMSEHVASANWMATASFLANQLCQTPHGNQALLVDIGSTTTDIIPINKSVLARGRTDQERLTYEELVYTGVVRTSLMSAVDRIPFNGEWVRPMAEHFATTADVYRLIGKLPEDADQMPSADGKGKSITESARRLARMIGADFESAPLPAWRRCAAYIAEAQLVEIYAACQRILSRGVLDDHAPLIGAGVGRSVAVELARRLGRPYLDFATFVDGTGSASNWSAHCAPAVAVAALLQSQISCI